MRTIPISVAIACLGLLLVPHVLSAQGENREGDQRFVIAANTGVEADSLEIIEKAEKLFRKKDYDGVITILAGPAYADPSRYDVNLLLARAQVEKCAELKRKGDPSYKTLVYRPYETAQRLHKVRTHQELYYITAKSLLINNRPARAVKTIKKALRLLPDTPHYLLVLGDAYYEQAVFAKKVDRDAYIIKRLFAKARAAYEEIMSLEHADAETKALTSAILNELSEQTK